ncbi:MAG: hydroxymethylglutaryl-CoA lyase [Herpetosiphon sp.]
MVDALSETGLREIEVTSFVHPRAVPQMADAESVCAMITRRQGVRYSAIAPNVHGARRAVAANLDAVQFFLSASEAHNHSNVNMSIAASLGQAADVASIVRKAGKVFDAVLSVVFGCPFEGDVPIDRVMTLCQQLLDIGAEQLTFGDTTGMAHPRLVRDVFVAFRERFPRAAVRFHPHSARGAGLANVLAALEVGINRLDASAGGIGGCPFAPGAPGNVCTEDLVHMLHEMGIATGVRLPLLIEVARQMEAALGYVLPGQTMKAGICGHLQAGEPRVDVSQPIQQRAAGH